MPSPHDTAYPRLKNSLSSKELADCFTPTAEELDLARQVAKGTGPRICFLLLLKTFQKLGYFMLLHKVPPQVAEHVALLFGAGYGALEWQAYDESGTRRRHVALIRERLQVQPFDDSAQQFLARTVRQAAHSKEDSVDIINIAIEELVRRRYELPGFTTLLIEARRGRAEVNRSLYAAVSEALGPERRERIDALFDTDLPNKRSLWHSIKKDAGAPTLIHLKNLLEHLRWLRSLHLSDPSMFAAVTAIKVEHFAREAKSLDAGRMSEMEPAKRYTLGAALIKRQIAASLDDLGEMLIKRMRKAQRQAQNALADYLLRHQSRTDEMVSLLHRLLLAFAAEGTEGERLNAISEVIGGRTIEIMDQCETYESYAGRNHMPFLWRFCKAHRRILFGVAQEADLIATSHDDSLIRALSFVKKHQNSKSEWLSLPEADEDDPSTLLVAKPPDVFSMRWVPGQWWKLVTGMEHRGTDVRQVNRRYFELCVFTQLANELQSGDIAIRGSDRFSDYREHFVSPEQYEASVEEYCEQVGLPAKRSAIIEDLKRKLTTTAARVDLAFPKNEHLRIHNGEPILSRLEKRVEPEQLKLVEHLLAERLSPVNILDVIADSESWLNWTRFFGLLSGHDAKIERAAWRYLTTVFCYGCNLGPSQTARSMRGVDRRHIGSINQRHITTESLDEAIAAIINGYNKFLLPSMWGSGESASADGTKWDIYEQNLLSEYHIRYGGYGGIGYYHVSDTYIALFSHFIPCGVWEAVYILDGLLKNKSDIQPHTLHSDTQGQSAPVFGLAYLLGIKLMPRIRNRKDLQFFRPEKETTYTHLDGLFSEAVNWDLISGHMDDMLRVTVSIKAGRLTASTLLRRLGTYSRKNRLYLAFRELGRVVRTLFLLDYINDIELRREIHGAINKSEGFNNFAQWVAFGGHGVIAENEREEQRKIIKYNHLVANCLIFYNVHAMTQALHDLSQAGQSIEAETLRRLSPYLTEHINRFGDYIVDIERKPPAVNYHLDILPFKLTAPE